MNTLKNISEETSLDGKIITPAIKSKWRLAEWEGLSPHDNKILSFQAINFNVISLPPRTALDDGEFVLTVEHDINGLMFNILNCINNGDFSRVRIELIDSDSNVLTNIIFYGVRIVNHQFDLDYTSSESLKSMLTYKFIGMKTFGPQYEWL